MAFGKLFDRCSETCARVLSQSLSSPWSLPFSSPFPLPSCEATPVHDICHSMLVYAMVYDIMSVFYIVRYYGMLVRCSVWSVIILLLLLLLLSLRSLLLLLLLLVLYPASCCRFLWRRLFTWSVAPAALSAELAYYTILYYTILYYTMLCYAMLCYAILYDNILCYNRRFRRGRAVGGISGSIT